MIVEYKSAGLTTVFLSCMLLMACSVDSKTGTTEKTKTAKKILSAEELKKLPKHIHPDTSCYNAFIHSHADGEKDHAHNKRDCDRKQLGNGNAHQHPSNTKTGSLRHVHPNGANPHSHH